MVAALAEELDHPLVLRDARSRTPGALLVAQPVSAHPVADGPGTDAKVGGHSVVGRPGRDEGLEAIAGQSALRSAALAVHRLQVMLRKPIRDCRRVLAHQRADLLERQALGEEYGESIPVHDANTGLHPDAR